MKKPFAMLTAATAAALVLGATSLRALADDPASPLYGEVVPATTATRTVTINGNTRWIDATELETVKFVSNGHEFAVDFDGIKDSFPLEALAPNGALDHHVEVFVHAFPGDNAGG